MPMVSKGLGCCRGRAGRASRAIVVEERDLPRLHTCSFPFYTPCMRERLSWGFERFVPAGAPATAVRSGHSRADVPDRWGESKPSECHW